MDIENDQSIHSLMAGPLTEYKQIVENLLKSIKKCCEGPLRDVKTETDHLMYTSKEIFSKMIEKEKKIVTLTSKLKEHERLYHELENIREQNKQKDDLILNYAESIYDNEQKISDVLKKHHITIEKMKKKSNQIQGWLDPDDIINYAKRITGTTSAPISWKPGQPMVGFMPPAPQEQMMRAGVLSRGIIAPLTVNDKYKEDTNMEDVETNLTYSKILKDDTNVGISLPDEKIAKLMPDGWKPGDPISLPLDPEYMKKHNITIPNDWKPGDTIPIDNMIKEKIIASSNEKANSTNDKINDKKDEPISESESSQSDSEEEEEKGVKIILDFSSDESDSD